MATLVRTYEPDALRGLVAPLVVLMTILVVLGIVADAAMA